MGGRCALRGKLRCAVSYLYWLLINSKYIISHIFMICKYFLTFCKKSFQKKLTAGVVAIFIEKYYFFCHSRLRESFCLIFLYYISVIPRNEESALLRTLGRSFHCQDDRIRIVPDILSLPYHIYNSPLPSELIFELSFEDKSEFFQYFFSISTLFI